MNFIKREQKLSLKYAELRGTVILNLGHIVFNLVRVSFTAISNTGNERELLGIIINYARRKLLFFLIKREIELVIHVLKKIIARVHLLFA